MATKSSYELHHHFPKLAEESGFVFNKHRPRNQIDWNKIRLINIDNIVRDRRFNVIEQHLSDILNCVLESEFDVRILDEGVLKMFRLAQLAVEYQQFCRHYLDRSVYVLREEITVLAQELDVTKKDLREKEEEIKKLRKKAKYITALPYGNDNIATMILKTLTNKGDFFPSTSNVDTPHYNKCHYCDKVFLNQLYLKSHVSRRHPNVSEMPQKDIAGTAPNTSEGKETSKLNNEITELKSKLKEMESIINEVHAQRNSPSKRPESKNETINELDINLTKKTKDAGVSTNNEGYLLDKIEEWKKEEYEKYNKEINLLRTQIIETMNSFKDKEIQQPLTNDSNLIEQLQVTIQHQGTEIAALKKELNNSKLISKVDETERRKETDTQMSFWAKRVEAQSKQYDSLLQKLNDVAKEAHESRAAAEAERERSAQLQALLQSLTKQDQKNTSPTNSAKSNQKPRLSHNTTYQNKNKSHKTDPVADGKTLEKLHRKAQELLSIASTTSSDVSSASVENITRSKDLPNSGSIQNSNVKKLTGNDEIKIMQHNKPYARKVEKITKDAPHEVIKNKEMKNKRNKSKPNTISAKQEENLVISPSSPIKVVRAKLTEEVNNRLVLAGVDPLKSRLPQSVFQKQRMQLQQQHESKSKKNPAYQKVKHSILAFLDSSAAGSNNDVIEAQNYISPSKRTKAFSLTSVISNVKSKALSLVKSNDSNSKRHSLNAEVAKKAMSLLKTPPGSAPTSPVAVQRTKNHLKMNDSPTEEMTRNSPNTKILSNAQSVRQNKEKPSRKVKQRNITPNDSDDKFSDSDHKYYNSAIIQQTASSVESLIKSPARRPASANTTYNGPVRKFNVGRDGELNLVRTQSAANISQIHKSEANNSKNYASQNNDSSDDQKPVDTHFRKSVSEENILNQNIPKQAKGVLKYASSTSSLNKKKVLFDMDAIQMKSVSASPSQSITDKSDAHEKFELGLVNLDGEEWDISSIENEPLNNDTKIQMNSRTSPKIAELKRTIETQLARRSETLSTALVGGVDILTGPMARATSIAGSNTSLGSSILDDSESAPVVNHTAFVKPKKVTEKDDSELDISEYSIDGLTNNNKANESF